MQEPHLAAVLADLDRLPPRADELLAGLDAARFTAVPPGGGWSIAQIFEHLCVADASYTGKALPDAIRRARARTAPPRPWRPSLLGGFLRRALVNQGRKLPAPKPYRVGAVRPDVVASWREGVGRLRELVVACDGLDLRTPLSSPVEWWLRMNLGDALAVPVVHGHRHLAQMERVRAALGG
jgi:hypothetical protein